jgi:hypothetical protein
MRPGDYYSLEDQPLSSSSSHCTPGFGLVNQSPHGANDLQTKLGKLNKIGPMLGTGFGKRKFGHDIYTRGGSPLPRPSIQRFGRKSIKKAMSKKLKLRKQKIEKQKFGRRKSRGRKSRGRKSRARKSRGRKSRARKSRARKSRARKSRARKSRARKSRARKSRARKSRARKSRRRRSFGETPGTEPWTSSAKVKNTGNKQMAKYANAGVFKPAKGGGSDVQLYVTPLKNKQFTVDNLNVPMQFSDNDLNTPLFKFGGKKNGFGHLKGGPNTVGYQEPIPMYHPGGTTIDFLTGKTNSQGIIGQVGKVQPDGMTPNAWLTKSVGIGDGLGNNYRFGTKGKDKRPKLKSKKSMGPKTKKFGNVYTPNGVTRGTGKNVIMQPPPDFPEYSSPVKGTYVGYGSKAKKKTLTAEFGGKTINLGPDGIITVSPKPVV